MKYLVLTIILCISALTFSYAQTWSFAVLADPRMDGTTFKNALVEIRDMRINPEQKLSYAEFIIVAGDFDPVEYRYIDFKKTFQNSRNIKAIFPVKGNHDKGRHTKYIIKKILPEQDSITVRDKKHVNYYIDWKNARFIMVDQYSDLGSEGCINKKGTEWVEGLIKSAQNTDHIFICYHEPAFPRYRHIGGSQDSCRYERDTFWDMLVRHREKVKAVFNGHSHYYYRVRVSDPRSDQANDPQVFPDQKDGIYQVDCGASGQGDRNTFVRVQIYDKNISFIVLGADDGKNKPFQIIDKWEIAETDSSSDE